MDAYIDYLGKIRSLDFRIGKEADITRISEELGTSFGGVTADTLFVRDSFQLNNYSVYDIVNDYTRKSSNASPDVLITEFAAKRYTDDLIDNASISTLTVNSNSYFHGFLSASNASFSNTFTANSFDSNIFSSNIVASNSTFSNSFVSTSYTQNQFSSNVTASNASISNANINVATISNTLVIKKISLRNRTPA
jgi:hypothetical protein